jgi:alpha-N-acetylglucosaminidase
MRKVSLTIIVCLYGIFVFAQTKNVSAARDLAKRLVPVYADKIVFDEIISSVGKDVFELQSRQGKLFIKGNSANSMAVGLNYYLKNYCNTSVSWYLKDKIFLPSKMPAVNKLVHQEARTQNRFFLNYCTFGYTMPWWHWSDWEHFIDWMALNGITLPLAITGEEYIWYKVWKKFGLSDDEIRSYFTGPAYLPWHRMANIDKWEGPLPHSWLNNQLELQKKIVKRERALSMKPVLPAFAGHVPEAIKIKYPGAKITSLGEWGDFDKKHQSYFLDPFDSLFNPIQTEFLQQQTKLFGTDHIYGTDPFNEVTPPSWAPEYLASASKVIYNSMAKVDAQAQWLQMTWIFYFNQEKWTNERIKAFLRAVPQDKMILLDYFCDNTEVWKKTESFFEQPYIWCYLGNFGGNTMLSGNIKEVEERLENTFNNGGKNLWGVGSTLEGFGINPVVYEYVLDKAWSSGPVDVDAWIQKWAMRRYGAANENATKAWKILLNTTYSEQAGLGRATLTNSRPVLEKFQSWTTNPIYHYNNKDLLQAWQLLNSATGKLTDVYKYDVVTVGNQVLGNYFKNVRDDFAKAYAAKDLTQLTFLGNKMIGIINDMDALLATNNNSLVGDWIETAKTFAANEQEKKYYEQDARKIITVWGQKGRSLTDYANRSIAGLMKDYYGGRWKMFVDEITSCVKNNKNYDEKIFLKKMEDFEENWAESNNPYSPLPIGNSLEVSKKLLAKYSAEIQAGQ